MKILHLTLHKEFFDNIAKRVKPLEYRDLTDYWKKRIEGREYDEIHFRNGYNKERDPFMRIKYDGWCFAHFQGEKVYGLWIGEILELKNWRPDEL